MAVGRLEDLPVKFPSRPITMQNSSAVASHHFLCTHISVGLAPLGLDFRLRIPVPTPPPGLPSGQGDRRQGKQRKEEQLARSRRRRHGVRGPNGLRRTRGTSFYEWADLAPPKHNCVIIFARALLSRRHFPQLSRAVDDSACVPTMEGVLGVEPDGHKMSRQEFSHITWSPLSNFFTTGQLQRNST